MHSAVKKFVQNLIVPYNFVIVVTAFGLVSTFFRVIYNLTLAFTTFTFSVY